jgi:hypothetical protein
VITFIDHETSFVTWLLAFVVWFSLGWMAFWVLPLLWPAFKDVVHHCPRCLNVIARKSRISLPTFRTEVMSIKVGGCAVVLARKYVMISLALIFVIITAYVLRSTVHLNPPQEMERGVPSLLTWEDFLFECGPRTTLQHRANTAKSFDEKFRKRTFTWQGEVRTIREGFDVWLLRTKSVVMVRMYPQRFPRRDLPDVALLFGESLNPEVGELNQGDWVQFEATMAAHGHRGDPEVMMLWHVRKVERPSPLSSAAASPKALHGDVDHKPGSLGKDLEAFAKAFDAAGGWKEGAASTGGATAAATTMAPAATTAHPATTPALVVAATTEQHHSEPTAAAAATTAVAAPAATIANQPPANQTAAAAAAMQQGSATTSPGATTLAPDLQRSEPPAPEAPKA